MRLGPLEYLGRIEFNAQNFPDIYNPIWIAAAVLFVLTIVLYNVRVRQLHRHEPLRAMQEWLMWTGLVTFGLILVGTIFNFYFLFIVLFIIFGLTAFIWVRFFRFPPYIEAYNEQLRRARFYSQSRSRHVESTVRSRRNRGQRRRRG